MKVLFLTGGQRQQALSELIKSGQEVVALVCPIPSSKNDRFLDAVLVALKNDIPIITVSKNDIFKKLCHLEFDILLSCGFSYILGEDVLSLARIANLNIHPTLLPKYRGYRSGPFIVINGEKKSGVTIHELTIEMDKGDILLQKEFEITPFHTTKGIFKKAQDVEPELIAELFKKFDYYWLNRYPQNELDATEYKIIRTPKHSEVDPQKSLLELYNFIRSCDFDDYPAFFYHNGDKVLIQLIRETNKNKPTPYEI